MRVFLIACILVGMSIPTMAQHTMNKDSFEAITVRKAEEIELDTKTFRITNIKGPVDLTFIAKEKVNNLDLKADKIQVQYTDKTSKAPSIILMEGNLDITIQGQNILSEKADINLDKGLAVFTGKTIVSLPDGEPMITQGISLDMNSDKLILHKPNIPSYSLINKTP